MRRTLVRASVAAAVVGGTVLATSAAASAATPPARQLDAVIYLNTGASGEPGLVVSLGDVLTVSISIPEWIQRR